MRKIVATNLHGLALVEYGKCVR